MITTINARQRKHAGHGPFQIDIVLPGINLEGALDHGFYNLGRFDHARLQPGALVAMHPHRNDEILSLLKRGTMWHRDSAGQRVQLSPQHLMMMNAGTGIYHEESIPVEDHSGEVEMLQIFIRPSEENLPPKVQFAHFASGFANNEWRLIAAEQAAPLLVRSAIAVWDATVQASSVLLPPSSFAQSAYLIYVFSGEVQLLPKALNLRKGDSVLIADEAAIALHAADEAVLVAFVMDRQASYTRAGMFSGLQ